MARPPSTYDGRTSTGYPTRLALATASSTLAAVAPGGCGIVELFQQLAEATAIFGQIDALGRGADDGHARGFQRQREIQRSLPAELHDHANLCAACGLVLVHRHHVFVGQRLEVQAVAGVVVGRDGLGIAVDHDGLEAVVAQRECSMAAAIIELNSLPDAVRAAAQNDDLLAIGRRRLVLFLVGRVQIRGEALKLGGASIDPLEYRTNIVLACAAGASSRWRPGHSSAAGLRPDGRRRSPCA